MTAAIPKQRRGNGQLVLLIARDLGDAVLCATCRATIFNYNIACQAADDEPCPGWTALQAATLRACKVRLDLVVPR